MHLQLGNNSTEGRDESNDPDHHSFIVFPMFPEQSEPFVHSLLSAE